MSCPKCIEGHYLPGEPTGTFPEGYQNAYFAPGPEAKTGHGRAIILLTDAFGLPLKNSRLIADILAKRLECDVWIPDYFNGASPIHFAFDRWLTVLCIPGRPIASLGAMVIPERAEQHMSLWDWVKFIGTVIPSIPAIFLSRPSVADARLASVRHSGDLWV